MGWSRPQSLPTSPSRSRLRKRLRSDRATGRPPWCDMRQIESEGAREAAKNDGEALAAQVFEESGKFLRVHAGHAQMRVAEEDRTINESVVMSTHVSILAYGNSTSIHTYIATL